MRCNSVARGKGTFKVAAGASLPVFYNQAPWHRGPYQVYMAKVPEGQDVNAWDGAGQVWFKVYSGGAYTGGCKYDGGNYCFPEKCKCHSNSDLMLVKLTMCVINRGEPIKHQIANELAQR